MGTEAWYNLACALQAQAGWLLFRPHILGKLGRSSVISWEMPGTNVVAMEIEKVVQFLKIRSGM